MADLTQTVPFSFNEIYTDLKQKFADKGYDIAEGSNTSQMIDLMSYLVSSLNVNTALNVNETILNYANREDNILEDARSIGYESTKSNSYIYNITVTTNEFKSEDYPDGGVVVIPKFAKFTSNGKNYYYTGEQIILKHLTEPQDILLQVKEGTWYRYTDYPDELQVVIDTVIENGVEVTRYYIDIPWINVEENGIQCFCSYYDDMGVFYDKVEFTRSQTTMFENDEEFDKKFVRLDNIDYKTPRIYFKYAGMGKGLKLGSEVYLNVLVTSGTSGEISDLSDTESIQTDISNIKIKNIELVQTGTNGETLQEIKDNAPKYYNSSNRLVTANDYISASQRDARVKKAIVWGGEDEFPMSPGHIWFSYLSNNQKRSFTMYDQYSGWLRDYQENYYLYGSTEDQTDKATTYYNNNYLTNTELRSTTYSKDGTLINLGIWDYLDNLNIPTLTYHHRHPIFCQFFYDIEILKYLISEDRESIHDEIFNIINYLFMSESSTHYENYDVEYFNASVIKYIDSRVTDISGFNLYVKNRLVLNTKTLCVEQADLDFRDVYIPLAIPYENYFDEDGFLKIEILPNIDTENFIQYKSEQGRDLFVDWSEIKKDIENGKPQKIHKLIIAPVKIKMEHEVDFIDKSLRKVQLDFQVQPDDVTQKEREEFTFNNTHVYLIKRALIAGDEDEYVELSYGRPNGWFVLSDDPTMVYFGENIDLSEYDSVKVYSEQFCGFYYLFNSYKKEILVHLFVDGSKSGYSLTVKGDEPYADGHYLYTFDEKYLFTNTEHYLVSEEQLSVDSKYIESIDTTPRSYLYSNDKSYLYTKDSYYLTTNGYALDDPNSVTLYTGSVVREFNKYMYLRSPLKTDLFFRNRYLNLKYNSDSFKVIKNVIPMLYQVEFKDVLR